MNNHVWNLPVLGMLSAGLAFSQATPTKVGIISIQQAIVGTKEGQQAAASLDSKTAPKRKELERKQAEIGQLQESLRKQSNTASEEVRAKLAREIEARTKSFNREMEDAQAEFDQEQQKVLQELGGKLMAVIDKYARDNGFALILDISQQNSPVLYAANSIDVTQEVIKLYDANTSPASATPAKPVADPVSAPAKPAAAAPKK